MNLRASPPGKGPDPLNAKRRSNVTGVPLSRGHVPQPAGNDRLDVVKLVSYSHLNQHAADIMEAPPDGSHEESNPCSRGTNTYVFLSWKMADSHELNLPISKLDFYIPG